MEKTITGIMRDEHERINKFLDESERLIDFSLTDSRKIFSKFKWNLEKHIFVEEKVIFYLCDSECGEEISDVFSLMQEHGEIIGIIKDAEKKTSTLKSDISKIRKQLEEHMDFEESKFYPLLDERLNPEIKQEIFDRAKEVIRE